MISRQAVLASFAIAALAVSGGCAAATAIVASAATADERAAAAHPTRDPEPAFHRLSPQPSPSTTTVVTGIYRERPLVVGEDLVDEAQLRAHVRELGWSDDDPLDPHHDTWIAEQLITIRCMAHARIFFDPRQTQDPPDFHGSDAERALFGQSGTGEQYRWQDAGCWGYAVHITGNDENH